jgi:hypothetical protein
LNNPTPPRNNTIPRALRHNGRSEKADPGSAGLPQPGILFYDITTLLKDPVGLRGVIDRLKDHYQHSGVEEFA